jgi:NAD kinase
VQVERRQSTMRCLAGRLVTWYMHQSRSAAEHSECTPEVAKAIDVVATLGGDGTLLWACKTMGSHSVPPVIPYAFGSLGFMTPFASSSIGQVLEVCATPCC